MCVLGDTHLCIANTDKTIDTQDRKQGLSVCSHFFFLLHGVKCLVLKLKRTKNLERDQLLLEIYFDFYLDVCPCVGT